MSAKKEVKMIGVDIVKIARFQRLIEKFGDRALEKFLCADEIALVKTAQSAAGFFAAKEAVAKALGLGISEHCGFGDIRICKAPNGAPYFTLSPRLVELYKITSLSLSITHDGGFAIAVAAIEGEIPQSRQLCH